MEEILQQVLTEIMAMNSRLDKQEQAINDLRDSTFKEFQGMHKELGAIRETQSVALDKWTESIDIQKRVERLLDERAVDIVALEAVTQDNTNRITALEQKAG